MGLPATVFTPQIDDAASQEEQSLALGELLDFIEKPNSIGLDNLKPSLRNAIVYMMELMGLESGHNGQGLLAEGHGGLMIGGKRLEHKRKKKLQEEAMRALLALERKLCEEAELLYRHVHTYIEEIKSHIDTRLVELNKKIDEENGVFGKQSPDLIIAELERENLLALKEQVGVYEEDLDDVQKPEELIEIEYELGKGVEQAEKRTKLTAEKKKRTAKGPTGIELLAMALEEARQEKKNRLTEERLREEALRLREKEDSSSGSGSTDGKGSAGGGGSASGSASGSGDDDSSSGGQAGEDDNIAPPPCDFG